MAFHSTASGRREKNNNINGGKIEYTKKSEKKAFEIYQQWMGALDVDVHWILRERHKFRLSMPPSAAFVTTRKRYLIFVIYHNFLLAPPLSCFTPARANAAEVWPAKWHSGNHVHNSTSSPSESKILENVLVSTRQRYAFCFISLWLSRRHMWHVVINYNSSVIRRSGAHRPTARTSSPDAPIESNVWHIFWQDILDASLLKAANSQRLLIPTFAKQITFTSQ